MARKLKMACCDFSMIRELSQLSIIVIVIALFAAGCKKSAADSQKPPSAPDARHSPQTKPTPSAPAQPKETLLSLIFTREKSLSYNGFDIATVAKRTKSERAGLSYAVIKKDGRVT